MRATTRRADILTQGIRMVTHTQDLLQVIQATTLLHLSSIRDLSLSVLTKAPQVVVMVTRLLQELLLLVLRCIHQVVVLQDLDLLQVTQSHLTRDIHLHTTQEVTRTNLMTMLQHLLRFITLHLTWETINFAKGGGQSTQSP